MKLPFTLIAILISKSLFADGYYPEPISQDQPWSVTASLGNGKYQSIHNYSNNTTLGRLALGNDMMLTGDLAWGLELGIQNGNKIYLERTSHALALIEWFPIKTNLGPMLDLLVTAKSDPIAGSSFFAQLKGGIAYRSWQITNQAIKDTAQLTAEFQAGLGYPITTLTSLNLLYQGVFSNEPYLSFHPYSKTGNLTNIPSLHAVLLGFSINI
ncbi:MAG: hypothetical protein CK426_02540 [Legionella sp.]|nr:MAG: hypothetical protein CK423_03340 [Legionella sp.]PJD99675.1 MAG: hypothetical protein CK426_02540 [Legionella sp.]